MALYDLRLEPGREGETKRNSLSFYMEPPG
jgi:hypothetical protein